MCFNTLTYEFLMVTLYLRNEACPKLCLYTLFALKSLKESPPEVRHTLYIVKIIYFTNIRYSK